MPELQILIAAYGEDALEKIAGLLHASRPGVEYLVGWQRHDRNRIPASLAQRADFRIEFEDSEGLCNNRNSLLQKATAPFCVIADDDLEYTETHLEAVLEGFHENQDCHFLTFRYSSPHFPKDYPAESFDMAKPPKGYFVTSMELAFNLRKLREDFPNAGPALFNPAFGINGDWFCCGEEDILVSRLLGLGCKGRFIPKEICLNTDSTTSERISLTKPYIETKGAVMAYVRHRSWPLRMIAHALRTREIPLTRYCRWWLAGVRKARRHKVFDNY